MAKQGSAGPNQVASVKGRRHLGSFLSRILAGLAVALFYAAAPSASWSQLDREMRDLFLEIKEELDGDLKVKFEAALQANTNRIFFSEDQFRRFRDNPINPFDGLHELDPEMYQGGIELKFELPSLRNRMVGRHERQNSRILTGLETLAAATRGSVLPVQIGSEQVALATAIRADGLLVTKASELKEKKQVHLRVDAHELATADVLRIDAENDIAVLKSRVKSLKPVDWQTELPSEGEFLVTAGPAGQALALGTLSHGPRPLQADEQAILGIRPQNADLGCELIEVTTGGAAEQAGLQVGDIVLQLDAQPIGDVSDLVNEIRRRRPGSIVALEILRGGKRQTVRATLAGRNLSPERAARFKMMNRLGAIPSARSADFPWVFQHDTPLFPEQCGGPLLDLDGNVVGINVARQGRISTLGIPASHMQSLLGELLRDDLAQSPVTK